MEHLARLALTQAGNLLVVATKVGERTMGGTTTQQRAGNDAIGSGLQLTSGQFVEVGPETGTYQTWLLDHRAGQGDNALHRQTPTGEQLAHGNHVLITDGP